MNTSLKKVIKQWLDDFEKTQPKNVEIDTDTFEGAAYSFLSQALAEAENDGFFVITRLHRDDLKEMGYDTSGVADEDMEEVANNMADVYMESDLYWESLKVIADELRNVYGKNFEGVTL